jgi:hypothetical protein
MIKTIKLIYFKQKSPIDLLFSDVLEVIEKWIDQISVDEEQNDFFSSIG